jgi:hypothetical protein
MSDANSLLSVCVNMVGQNLAWFQGSLDFSLTRDGVKAKTILGTYSVLVILKQKYFLKFQRSLKSIAKSIADYSAQMK